MQEAKFNVNGKPPTRTMRMFAVSGLAVMPQRYEAGLDCAVVTFSGPLGNVSATISPEFALYLGEIDPVPFKERIKQQ